MWVKCPHSQKKFAASLLKKASLLHTHTLCIIKYESVFLKCRNFRRRKRKKASTTVYKLSCDPGSTRYERKRLVSMRSLSLSLLGSKTKRFEILCGGPSSRGVLSSDDARALSRGLSLSLSLSLFLSSFAKRSVLIVCVLLLLLLLS